MAFVLCPSGALLAKARGFVAGSGVLPGSIEPSDIEVTVTAKKSTYIRPAECRCGAKLKE